MTNPAMVMEVSRDALILTLVLSAPMLLGGLVVGIAVGIFQAVTQIHEMTLAFIPKILVMVGILLAILPWMMAKFVDYTIALFDRIPQFIH
jgi:flagellar biosynthetic protein FliQ